MNFIVCVDANWGIGYKNELLVRIPSDQKFFRETTTGKVVVMGRKTLDSFPGGKPLKNRTNIVITSNKNCAMDWISQYLEQLELLKNYNDEDIYIIGGASIYKQFLPYCSKALVTRVDREFSADTYFPNLEEDPEWKLVKEGEEQTYFDNTFEFLVYERV